MALKVTEATFSWAKKHIVEVLNLLALLGVLLTIYYAHSQLQEARRTAEASSLFALKADLDESRRHFYGPLLTAVDSTDSQAARISHLRMNLVNHLLTIEYSCRLYLDEMLGEEAERFLEVIIKEELNFLGDSHWGYENGEVVLSDDNRVPWVDPDAEGTDPDYPRTLECADRLGVSIGSG